jgi:tetratricopeptide (TPR) repeat protein
LEAQSGLFASIDDTLAHPERTRARERRERGVAAYQKGLLTSDDRWFNDATIEFKAAVELDPYDHIPHIFLGTIAALDGLDDEQAEKSFGDAAHYAWPDAPEAAAAALVWRSLIAFAAGRFNDAIFEAQDACRKAPQLVTPRLALARAYAAADRQDDLEAAIIEALAINPLFDSVYEADQLVLAGPGARKALDAARIAREPQLREARAMLQATLSVLETWGRWVREIEQRYPAVVEMPRVGSSIQELLVRANELVAQMHQYQNHASQHLGASASEELVAFTFQGAESAAELLPQLRESVRSRKAASNAASAMHS